MMNWLGFDKIEYFYNTKMSNGERLWSIEQVKVAVVREKISPEEFKKITGEDYIA
ncbi:hypothetical protein C672_1730 [[Clostridium] bifermentans ATCC 638]|uniref:XkdX family protein n=1 Tax=Paraclostridium bifermentans ATCC 638 = DSM 14991 TaxID=1233171 RepID=T4VPU9_PARBF|nr:XkdX family protein [Paraclostridium bifermentans]EQK42786.1 hypothetical protein C672_1730 [[Clostridium] bifermentans ATCC 638] [Paraclostridium bifermentans ATCC 638 = DSM 14991]RIZ58462.1 XkdX family protein [Paraclostridium bifermentans]